MKKQTVVIIGLGVIVFLIAIFGHWDGHGGDNEETVGHDSKIKIGF